MKVSRMLVILAVGFSSLVYQAPNAKAEESAVNKAKDNAGDAATDAKVGARNGKQKMRKMIGTDTKTQDAKDSLNNAADKTGNAVDKAARKTNESN